VPRWRRLTTNKARLTPYAKNPTTSAPAKFGNGGTLTPIIKAKARFTEPATSPLTEAIHVASESDTLRVKLLSRPQAKHAPRMASAGHDPAKRASPGQLNTTAPATIATMPSAIRRSKFSLNTTHAKRAVN